MNVTISKLGLTAVFSVVGLLAILTVVLLAWQPWTGDASARPAESTSTTTTTAVATTTTTTTRAPAEGPEPDPASQRNSVVINANDSGPGSLRQAIADANLGGGKTLIRFDSVTGPFADPQLITLASPLPEITGDVEISGFIPDRLWTITGVTLSGASEFRVFTVAKGARLKVLSLTISDGRASDGAGVLNHGELVVTGSTFVDNRAHGSGGALANAGGEMTIINSTFARNTAVAGGGVSNLVGSAVVTNSTFSENSADRGGALLNEDEILVSNTILANSEDGGDCVSTGSFDSASVANLIEENVGCGDPISSADPALEPMGYYNGPAQTFPLTAASPAINLGVNEAAVDENGEPLVWDQRGNGDPRFVAGFADIGAFERQVFPNLVVDTVADVSLRACTGGVQGDCPLRAAIELANATAEPDVVTFDPSVFEVSTTLTFSEPLPQVTSDLTLDASEVGRVTLRDELRASSRVELRLVNVAVR